MKKLQHLRSILVTKDMLHTSSRVSNHATENCTFLLNNVVVLSSDPILADREKCAPHVTPKRKTIVWHISVHC